MATSTLYEKFILDEAAAQKLISTPATKVKETNVFSDINLNEKERVARATKLLASRKWK
ncbi:hypothetical protein QMA09_15790 [Planococcus sp. APC 3906]|uniref:hypothetical protein n=1 Tax=Planococcus sp. APC 3906 TaxID=3035194 RepID=UPI0025B47666|nr:hypothetical protein [Planococcus sp. APC 3906]MDN3451661.1 hypothetical protein [Planococcus sp. APC 3906]